MRFQLQSSKLPAVGGKHKLGIWLQTWILTLTSGQLYNIFSIPCPISYISFSQLSDLRHFLTVLLVNATFHFYSNVTQPAEHTIHVLLLVISPRYLRWSDCCDTSSFFFDSMSFGVFRNSTKFSDFRAVFTIALGATSCNVKYSCSFPHFSSLGCKQALLFLLPHLNYYFHRPLNRLFLMGLKNFQKLYFLQFRLLLSFTGMEYPRALQPLA